MMMYSHFYMRRYNQASYETWLRAVDNFASRPYSYVDRSEP
jgi:hypothetical protein